MRDEADDRTPNPKGLVTFAIDSKVAAVFPDILAGAVRVSALDRAAKTIGDGQSVIREAEAALQQAGLRAETLPEEPRIRGWRDAIQRCGLKPSGHRGSAEQLARRLLKGQGVSTPLPIVNAYCGISAKHLAPMGGYDLHRLPTPDLALRFPDASRDTFGPLGGRPQDMPLDPTVACYAAGTEIICYAFNHRDSAKTSLVDATTEAVFFSEAVTTRQHEAARAALDDLATILRGAGARVGPAAYADASRPLFELAEVQ